MEGNTSIFPKGIICGGFQAPFSSSMLNISSEKTSPKPKFLKSVSLNLLFFILKIFMSIHHLLIMYFQMMFNILNLSLYGLLYGLWRQKVFCVNYWILKLKQLYEMLLPIRNFHHFNPFITPNS